MSDDILKIIPATPDFAPKASAISGAESYLRELGFTLDATAMTSEIEFVDCGGNLERISCPFCGAVLATESWQDAMNRSYETRFADRNLKLPCCKRNSKLEDLIYDWPMGFAKFVLHLRNPVDLWGPGILTHLELLLDTPLREIWAHY